MLRIGDNDDDENEDEDENENHHKIGIKPSEKVACDL